MPVVLSNSSPLIAMGKLNRLEILAGLYSEVRIPRAVFDEVVTRGTARGDPDALSVRLFWQQQSWPVVDIPSALLSAYKPPIVLDAGELQVLALAQTIPDPLVLLDDEIARAEARRLKLATKGTLGVLVQAHRQSLLSYTEVELLLNEIAARPDIWISAKLCHQVLASLHKPVP